MTTAWVLFLIYVLVTSFLAWKGGQQGSDDAEGFAIGNGRMNPWVVGITLGACLASSATFVIIPGFVYAEGLPALIGFTVPFIAGIAIGLLAMSPRFQSLGASNGALTLPHWLGERYRSHRIRQLFAALNVLQIAYMVLITVGCGYVMVAALGVSYEVAVVGIVVFVFGYTGFGGSYAHAFTNSMQGAVMLVMALVIFGSGAPCWADGSVVRELSATGLTAPGSVLFSTPWEVWGISFAMGLALTTQPHLLTKALYVEGRRDLRIVVGTGIATYCVFALVLFAGLYARITLPPGLPPDQVMAAYLGEAFPWAWLGPMVSVAILAASMSTLDGLLVAVSASVANDVLPGRGSVWLNRAVLVVLAVVTIAISLHPPGLVLLVGQLGVYGLVAASAGPLLVGLFAEGDLDPFWAGLAAVAALCMHFGVVLGGLSANPGVGAVAGMAVGVPLAVTGLALSRRRRRQHALRTRHIDPPGRSSIA
jgi:SSS family solute:Na+ symporter/sodium/pantothenate symporter